MVCFCGSWSGRRPCGENQHEPEQGISFGTKMWALKFLSLLWVLWLCTPLQERTSSDSQRLNQRRPIRATVASHTCVLTLSWSLTTFTANRTLQKSTMVTAFSEHKTRPSGPNGMAGTIGKKNRSCDFFEMLEVKMASLLPGYWKCLFGRVNWVKVFNGGCPSLPHVENTVGFLPGWLSLFFFCSISLCSKVFFGRRGSS